MAVFRIEIIPRHESSAFEPAETVARLREAGLAGVLSAQGTRLFFLEGGLSRAEVERIAAELLADPVTEKFEIVSDAEPTPIVGDGFAFEIHLRPGVMDPVAETTLAELEAEGFAVEAVRTARRFVVAGEFQERGLLEAVHRVLANDCIEQVVPGSAGVRPSPKPTVFEFELRPVAILNLDDPALEKLSRDGHLFLSIDELREIQRHFRALGREPTDLELETLAQTWSEHCVHKTFKSAIVYRGSPMPRIADRGEERTAEEVEIRYENLLKDTIVRATEELIAENRGPRCLSIFKDNAGVIAFDDEFGIAFKVETHNHPSAIEPYGGAATGVGGCIRDILGCGLGARPIANTDVFCVAPQDWPQDRLPNGVLHPRRVLSAVVRGVADYGNRMGIPTVNGAIHFDPRYLGNPLVFCGCVGLIPRDKIEKAPQPGDFVVVIGGRTGRDGIHGATFSSAELTDTHADEFSHAVQIGNPITEKRILDAILRSRDDDAGCLYSAITDCGAGGLSSAVGEMGEHVGAVVDLESVPLKYAGLRYDEIWISEAQERMVVAVPPRNLARFLEIAREEEVEATKIGVFGNERESRPALTVRYRGHDVGELDMRFLHDGLPKQERIAEWSPPQATVPVSPVELPPDRWIERLLEHLARPAVRAKNWVIRQFDHEVQGGSVIKPLCGPGLGPSDAAVLRPRFDSQRGVAVGCGMATRLADVDPYWMAIDAVDEAIRNVVCVGGDPRNTAMLDNFCWGRTDDPRRLGELVRACQGCCDAARNYGVPFISGKDSLNNEFALGDADVETLLQTLESLGERDNFDGARLRDLLPTLRERIRETKRLGIPGTLLISAVSIVDDVRTCVTADLKSPGNTIYLVDAARAGNAALHELVASAIRAGLVAACHDRSDGGLLVAVAEMAIGGDRGVALRLDRMDGDPFSEHDGGYVIETARPEAFERHCERGNAAAVRALSIGEVVQQPVLRIGRWEIEIVRLRAAWTS